MKSSSTSASACLSSSVRANRFGRAGCSGSCGCVPDVDGPASEPEPAPPSLAVGTLAAAAWPPCGSCGSLAVGVSALESEAVAAAGGSVGTMSTTSCVPAALVSAPASEIAGPAVATSACPAEAAVAEEEDAPRLTSTACASDESESSFCCTGVTPDSVEATDVGGEISIVFTGAPRGAESPAFGSSTVLRAVVATPAEVASDEGASVADKEGTATDVGGEISIVFTAPRGAESPAFGSFTVLRAVVVTPAEVASDEEASAADKEGTSELAALMDDASEDCCIASASLVSAASAMDGELVCERMVRIAVWRRFAEMAALLVDEAAEGARLLVLPPPPPVAALDAPATLADSSIGAGVAERALALPGVAALPGGGRMVMLSRRVLALCGVSDPDTEPIDGPAEGEPSPPVPAPVPSISCP